MFSSHSLIQNALVNNDDALVNVIKQSLNLKFAKSKKVSQNQLSSNLTQVEVLFNQTVLKSIIETIILCGRQALSLRGLRDDPQFYNSSLLELPSVKVGIFVELIHFGFEAGDEI